MSTDRITRVNELLRREIGAALFPVLANDARLDVSCVTVTRVVASRDLRHARVFISVRGSSDEQERGMRRLKRHRHELQTVINRNLKLKYTPQLIFELDTTLAQGDRVLGMLNELVPDTDPPPEADKEWDHDNTPHT